MHFYITLTRQLNYYFQPRKCVCVLGRANKCLWHFGVKHMTLSVTEWVCNVLVAFSPLREWVSACVRVIAYIILYKYGFNTSIKLKRLKPSQFIKTVHTYVRISSHQNEYKIYKCEILREPGPSNVNCIDSGSGSGSGSRRKMLARRVQLVVWLDSTSFPTSTNIQQPLCQIYCIYKWNIWSDILFSYKRDGACCASLCHTIY